jgi:hypothetical protein
LDGICARAVKVNMKIAREIHAELFIEACSFRAWDRESTLLRFDFA